MLFVYKALVPFRVYWTQSSQIARITDQSSTTSSQIQTTMQGSQGLCSIWPQAMEQIATLYQNSDYSVW